MSIGIGIGIPFGKSSIPNPDAQAPVNTSPPVISPEGNQVIGTVFTSGNGSWFATRPLTFEYRWTRNGTPISGATSQTYTSVSADEGQTLRCEVRATNAFGVSSYIASSNSSTGVSLPVNTVAPVISGSTTLGSVLSTTNGTWTGTATITFSYQWKRGGVSIGGATSSTYTLVAADSSANITCEVTGTNVAGSVAANSNTITAANFNPVNTVAPTLSPSGTQSTGTVITLGNGTWSGATPITFEYRWTRDNIVISGQTSNTYTIVAGDDGTVIKGQVRAINSVSTSAYVTTSNQVDANNVLNTARTQAFLTATGITDQTIIDALNAMDTSLISAGLLPSGTGAGKIKVLYPFAGSTATTHKFNFVNPLDTDAAFRLNFLGGWTHDSNGAKGNGSNATANTFFNINSNYSDEKISFGRYNDQYTSGIIIGGKNPATGNDTYDGTAFSSGLLSISNSLGFSGITKQLNGFVSLTRRNTTQIEYYREGTTDTYMNLFEIKTNGVMFLNSYDGTQLFGNARLKLIYFADELINSELNSLRTINLTYQTALGRQN
jgi:hypothetical protein